MTGGEDQMDATKVKGKGWGARNRSAKPALKAKFGKN